MRHLIIAMQSVGVVNDLVGRMTAHRADAGMVTTSSCFLPDANFSVKVGTIIK